MNIYLTSYGLDIRYKNYMNNYVTIDDVKIAKNYLSEIEFQRLNLLVSQFLDYAKLQALE